MWGCFSYYYYSLYHSYSISNKALSSDQRLLHDGSRKPLLPILKLISLFILLTFKICPQVNQYNYIYHACLVCACAYVPPSQCFLLYYSTFVFFMVIIIFLPLVACLPETLDGTLFAHVTFGLVLGRLCSRHAVKDRQPNHWLRLQAHPLQEVRHLNCRFP